MLETQLDDKPKTFVFTLNEIEEAAHSICAALTHKVLLISGEMGSGKTTLIKALVAHLNSSDTVSSPTFSIVNEYATTNGGVIFHFDLYRIESKAELDELGFDSYFQSPAYIFIEWPEYLFGFQPSKYHCLFIHESAENERTVTLYS
ncbi:MAG: tRNA (adenosine(37)-N6)-threonylcarbamoyltransferase complex ATPase subunit type 1 TsaE [Bacteroidetes bacterium]|nr:tRNA (adenosine(37)-N6)-threonylcarbamoyltransferase complex ATPase subunit type 1 TsaE [Bacteroidota bacterium]